MTQFYEVIVTEDAAPLKTIVHGVEEFGLHWHNELEILLVLKGSIEVRIGGKRYILEEDDFIIINSKEIHSISKTDEENIILALQIHPDYYRYFYPEFSNIHFKCNSLNQNENNKERYNTIRYIMAKILWKINKKPNGYRFKIANELNSLAIHIINNFDNETIEDERDRVSTGDMERIERILKYIDNNIERKITLKEIAENEDISNYYLSRFFREKIGISFQEYLNIIRIDNAVNLLLSTDYNITDIAFQSGFSSTHYFNKVFKENYNYTPREYRDNYSNKRRQIDKYEEKRSKSYLDVDRVAVFEKLFRYLDYKTHDTKERNQYSIENIKKNLLIDIDKVEEKSYKSHWKNLVCFGRAAEGLRSNVQNHIREILKEISFNYIRFHGIFMDEMMIYNLDKDGQVFYNWTYVNELLDFFIEVNIKPFIELGFMPSELRRSDETVHWWKGNISPPKDINLWTNLVKEFIKHCINRYGIKEVKTWYFEIWNEPELEYVFWAGTKEEYFQFFKETVLAIKSISKELKVGGPAVSCGTITNSTWLVDFLKYSNRNNIPLDFISTHIYPEYIPEGELDQIKSNGVDNSFIYHEEDHSKDMIKYINNKTENILKFKPEIHITEWNASSYLGNLIHDTVYVASYIIKNVLDSIDKVDSLGYWVLTDIFEENKLGISHFHGGFGLINKDGIKKASYYAYYLLNKLGNKIIDQGEDYIITRNNEDIQILAYNFVYFDKLFLSGDISALRHTDRYNVFEKADLKEIDLNIQGLSGNYKITKYKLNQEYGSAYDKWVEFGAIENMTNEEIEYIKGISKPKMDIENVEIKKEYKEQLNIPVHGIELITIEKVW